MPAQKKTDLPLEKILEKLDEITQKLDTDLPLDDALRLYEDGVGLIKTANKMISNAEAKIKTLNIQGVNEESQNDE